MKQIEVKTVVVGLDFSWYSNVVLKEALQLAKQMNAPLVAVHVGEKPYTGLNPKLFPVHELEAWYLAKINKQYPALRKHKVIIKLGSPNEKIIEVARKHKKPLIVIGHRGQSMMSRLLMGSVAEKLSQSSPYPIWIHRGEKTNIPKKILLPCDLQKRSSDLPSTLSKFQKVFGAQFELFHVMEDPAPVLDYELWSAMAEAARANDNDKLDILKKNNPNVPVKRTSGDIPREILKRSKAFDLIALPRRNARSSHLFFGSVSRKLVRNGQKPVLILP